jgi:hypothetical protein
LRTAFVVFDGAKQLFWVFDNFTMSEESIEEWIKTIASGNIKGSGPGRGILGIIRRPYFERRASGKYNPFMPYAIPIVVIVSLVVGGISSCLKRSGRGSVRPKVVQQGKRTKTD